METKFKEALEMIGGINQLELFNNWANNIYYPKRIEYVYANEMVLSTLQEDIKPTAFSLFLGTKKLTIFTTMWEYSHKEAKERFEKAKNECRKIFGEQAICAPLTPAEFLFATTFSDMINPFLEKVNKKSSLVSTKHFPRSCWTNLEEVESINADGEFNYQEKETTGTHMNEREVPRRVPLILSLKL